MVKVKREIFARIADETDKNITYCKRRKGLIKKAMELSLLCGAEIELAIHMPNKQRCYVYQSNSVKPKVDILEKCYRNLPDFKMDQYGNSDAASLGVNVSSSSLSDYVF